MPKIAIIINESAGTGSTKTAVSELAQAHENFQFKIIDFNSRNISKDITQLAAEGCTIIAAGGGDGTVSKIAGSIVELGLPLKLAVLPLGTYNHFAKDLGIPLRLEAAFDVLVKGKSARIDIGKVNDIHFINNSSLGLYPNTIRERDNIRKKGLRKNFALLVGFMRSLRARRLLTIEFVSHNSTISKMTPFVFIGNNKYEFSGFKIGGRKRLDEGIFSLALMKNVSRAKLVALSLKAVLGTLLADTDFNVLGLREFTITAKKNKKQSIDVSHDGEVSAVMPPLHYQLLPRALSVIIP